VRRRTKTMELGLLGVFLLFMVLTVVFFYFSFYFKTYDDVPYV